MRWADRSIERPSPHLSRRPDQVLLGVKVHLALVSPGAAQLRLGALQALVEAAAPSAALEEDDPFVHVIGRRRAPGERKASTNKKGTTIERCLHSLAHLSIHPPTHPPT